jgi:hypothetical protein
MDPITEKINNYIQRHTGSFSIVNISPGILIRRIIQGDKAKFKVSDNKPFTTSDHLDLFNLCKKKYPQLLQSSFASDEELLFLFSSPYHADHITSYKEELNVISLSNTIATSEYLIAHKLTQVPHTTLEDIQEDRNYIVILSSDEGTILDSQTFHCDQYNNYLHALKEATFGNFLNIIRSEQISCENTLISYLAKTGIPIPIQDKYLEFLADYNKFMDIVDEICLIIKKRETSLDDYIDFSSSKDVSKSLIRYFKYDVIRAQDFLEEIS